jgi:hypothetical protein
MVTFQIKKCVSLVTLVQICGSHIGELTAHFQIHW